MGAQNSTKLIAGAVIGALVFGAVAMGGAAWVLLGRSGEKTPMMGASGSIASAGGSYKPTSAWIEEGLDPDKVTFDMANGPAKGADAPDFRDIDGDIHNAVMAKQNDLMQCYATVLQEEDVQGSVDMQFGIAPDGHVAMVKVTKSSLASKSAEDCFVKTARSWKFPSTGRASLTKFDTDFGFFYE